MQRVIVLLAVAATIFASASIAVGQPATPQLGGPSPRVIGGALVPAADLESLGLVHVDNGGCSGVLLTNEWIVTAAHCLSAMHTMNPGSLRIEARWTVNQIRQATQIYRFWELKANNDPERAHLLDMAFIRIPAISVNGSFAGYQRALSTLAPDAMIGRAISAYGQGMEREAFMQTGVPMPALFTNTFRNGVFQVDRAEQNLFWYSRNAANQMVGGGDSGGPSFDGDQLAGVHSLCLTSCLPGQTCPPDSWMWVDYVSACADAPMAFARGVFDAMRRDPAWDPTRAFQDIVTTEFAPNIPAAHDPHERTVWPVVQSSMFRFCERRGFVAALARYGASTSPNVLCLGASAARVISLPASDVPALTSGASDLLALPLGQAVAAATSYCGGRVLGSIGGFPGGVVHGTGPALTYDVVCVLDTEGDRKMVATAEVAEHATLPHAEFRSRGDDACRAWGYALGGFVTGVPTGTETSMTCFGSQGGGQFDTRVPDEIMRARRALYAVSIDEPLIAPDGAAIDVQLLFKLCHDALVLSYGCPVEASVEQWSYNPQTQQVLHLDSGKCLNVSGASGSPGAWVILYPCTGSALNERWTVSALGASSVWTIKSASSGLCLHALPEPRPPAASPPGGVGFRLRPPAKLTQMPCDGSTAQQFSNVDADWDRRHGPH